MPDSARVCASDTAVAAARIIADPTLVVRSNPDQVAATPATLLRLDPGSLDQRPPFRDLCLVIGTQRLRRLLFAGRNLLAQVSQSLTHGGVGQGLDYSRVEPRDNLLGRALGDPDRVPNKPITTDSPNPRAFSTRPCLSFIRCSVCGASTKSLPLNCLAVNGLIVGTPCYCGNSPWVPPGLIVIAKCLCRGCANGWYSSRIAQTCGRRQG